MVWTISYKKPNKYAQVFFKKIYIIEGLKPKNMNKFFNQGLMTYAIYERFNWKFTSQTSVSNFIGSLLEWFKFKICLIE
jgi:hypothetical protein